MTEVACSQVIDKQGLRILNKHKKIAGHIDFEANAPESIISVPYRTRSLYSGTEMVPTSAFFSFRYQMRSGILQTCTKEGSSVWVAAQLRGCSIA
jgi:hypothetical protein